MIIIDASIIPFWRKKLLKAELYEAFPIDKEHHQGLPQDVVKALDTYELHYLVAKVPPEEAESWLSEGGFTIFKFWAEHHPSVTRYSGNSPLREMREPTLLEERLLEYLIETASKTVSLHWKEGLLVSPMNDGRMGSLSLFPKNERHSERVFGERISEREFLDQDGTPVIASLNVDQTGRLFELDLWKTDFSPLISFPEC